MTPVTKPIIYPRLPRRPSFQTDENRFQQFALPCACVVSQESDTWRGTLKTVKLIPQLSESDKTRFWSKVKIAGPDECWEWTAGKHCRGYGQFGIGRSMFLSHRISYVLANGEFTEDKPHTLHSCDNRLCQNPAHLSAGTNADNVQDMVKKGRGPSGDKNGSRTKPECLIRGEATCTAKLTGTQVVEIRNIYSQGKLSQLKLAKKFGVSQSIIYLIVNRKRWAHIP